MNKGVVNEQMGKKIAQLKLAGPEGDWVKFVKSKLV